jgi:hypothetical protein
MSRNHQRATKGGFTITLGPLLAAWLVLGFPGPALAIPFDLGAGGDFGATGNKGTSISATKNGLTLTLSALTAIDPSNTVAISNGVTGTVFIDPLGGGVQRGNATGSTGISGIDGPKGDEAVIFTFSQPFSTSQTVLIFNNYEIGSDDVVIYLGPISAPTLSTSLIEQNLACIGMQCTLNFSTANLAFQNALSGISSYTTMHVRATQGHFFVTGGAATPVPEPATLILLGSGVVGLAFRNRRKRHRDQSQPSS